MTHRFNENGLLVQAPQPPGGGRIKFGDLPPYTTTTTTPPPTPTPTPTPPAPAAAAAATATATATIYIYTLLLTYLQKMLSGIDFVWAQLFLYKR